jgi:hypothetical protein
MTRNEFLQYLESIKGQYEFTGGATEQAILDFEKKVHFDLPQDYRWILSTYGSIRVPGVAILGIAHDNFNMSLECIEKNTKRGLPEKIIPVLDYGEYVYCINCASTDIANIINWEPYGEIIPENIDLYTFITNQFQEALDE